MKKLLLTSLMLGTVSTYAQTVKKVVIEDYTGRWCQYCPAGTVILEGLHAANKANLIPIANHNDNNATVGGTGDPLEIAEGEAIPAFVGIGGFPNGGIDRKKFPSEADVGVSRGKWSSYFDQQKVLPGLVSISFTNHKKVDDTTFEMDVNVKFTAAPAAGPLSVQVYVLEDRIPAETSNGLHQINTAGGPNGGVSPLTSSQHGYYHDNTLRKALGGIWGWTDVIPSAGPTVGATYTKHVKFTIPGDPTKTKPTGGWKVNELSVVGFVSYNGTTADKKEIINAEELSLKAFFPNAVNEVKQPINFMNTYPNPARTTDVIKVEYSVEKSSQVTLKVYNSIGQLVAMPYNSNEAAGSHTIHWRPADNGAAPGLYILELSAGNSKTTQRMSIQ